MSSLFAIVAMDKNGAIGKNNGIPWRSKTDMLFFKEVTLGYPIIMGRNTWNSLPFKPLKDRDNIVITSNRDHLDHSESPFWIASNLLEAIDVASCRAENIFIIGGERVYKEALPLLNILYVTHMDTVVEDADAFFPDKELLQSLKYKTIVDEPASDIDEHNFEIRKYYLK